jgi:DNA polymerase III epsilon subunit-like protein
MKGLVFDIEANGLLKEVTQVWCIAGVSTENIEYFIDKDDLSTDNLISFFKGYDKIIGHNIINYDIPLLRKMFSFDIYDLYPIEDIVDTYIYSRVIYPDRPLPQGCPTTIRNPVTKRIQKIGPHSLEAHGYSVGVKKIEISDWTIYDEKIVERCITDVKINLKVYKKLLNEAGIYYE